MPWYKGADGDLYGTTNYYTCCGDPPATFGTVFGVSLSGQVVTRHNFEYPSEPGWPDQLQRGVDGHVCPGRPPEVSPSVSRSARQALRRFRPSAPTDT